MAGAVMFSSKTNCSVVSVSENSNPTLLAQIHMSEYVSLPVLEGLRIQEETYVQSDEAFKETAFEILCETTERLSIVTEDCTVVTSCTISKEDVFLEHRNEYLIGLSDEAVVDGLKEALLTKGVGETIQLKGVDFDDYESIDLRLTIEDILNITYPLTDTYMQTYTEYESFEAIKT